MTGSREAQSVRRREAGGTSRGWMKQHTVLEKQSFVAEKSFQKCCSQAVSISPCNRSTFSCHTRRAVLGTGCPRHAVAARNWTSNQWIIWPKDGGEAGIRRRNQALRRPVGRQPMRLALTIHCNHVASSVWKRLLLHRSAITKRTNGRNLYARLMPRPRWQADSPDNACLARCLTSRAGGREPRCPQHHVPPEPHVTSLTACNR